MAVDKSLYFIALNRLYQQHKPTLDRVAAEMDAAVEAWRAASQNLRINAAIAAGVPASEAEAYVAEVLKQLR